VDKLALTVAGSGLRLHVRSTVVIMEVRPTGWKDT
jgi:hypothetical protein